MTMIENKGSPFTILKSAILPDWSLTNSLLYTITFTLKSIFTSKNLTF